MEVDVNLRKGLWEVETERNPIVFGYWYFKGNSAEPTLGDIYGTYDVLYHYCRNSGHIIRAERKSVRTLIRSELIESDLFRLEYDAAADIVEWSILKVRT